MEEEVHHIVMEVEMSSEVLVPCRAAVVVPLGCVLKAGRCAMEEESLDSPDAALSWQEDCMGRLQDILLGLPSEEGSHVVV